VAAGFGDGLTFGGTAWVRRKLSKVMWDDDSDSVDKNSSDYAAAEFTGQMYGLAMGGAGVVAREGTAAVQVVTHWDTTQKIAVMAAVSEEGGTVLRAGQWVMTGASKGVAGARNYLMAGGPELGYKFGDAVTTVVKGANLRYPIAEEGLVMGTIKGIMGQRVFVP
jgi:hypothetical protein